MEQNTSTDTAQRGATGGDRAERQESAAQRLYARRRRFRRPGPKDEAGDPPRPRPGRIAALPDTVYQVASLVWLDSDGDWAAVSKPDPRSGDFPIVYDLRGRVVEHDGTHRGWLAAISSVYGRSMRVGRTTLFHRGARITVSTVSLGFDQEPTRDVPPVLWETKVWLGYGGRPVCDALTRRYCSLGAAVAGHGHVVQAIRYGYGRRTGVAR